MQVLFFPSYIFHFEIIYMVNSIGMPDYEFALAVKQNSSHVVKADFERATEYFQFED